MRLQQACLLGSTASIASFCELVPEYTFARALLRLNTSSKPWLAASPWSNGLTDLLETETRMQDTTAKQSREHIQIVVACEHRQQVWYSHHRYPTLDTPFTVLDLHVHLYLILLFDKGYCFIYVHLRCVLRFI
jgi:hypothetical protein